MKTIVLIGKESEALETVCQQLRARYKVYLSTEGHKNALGLIKTMKPDLVVVDLAGLGTMDRSLFIEIRQEHSELPVFTLGTEAERLPFASFHWEEQFKHIPRSNGNQTLLLAVSAQLDEMQTRKSGAEEAAANERKTVLVVDDDSTTLRSIKSMLEGKYNVMLANSGMKALKSIGKSRPDVILLDYEMPVCDGRQTLAMIRSDEEIADIPVIFLTSVNDKELIQAVLKLLPAGYLLKPAIPSRVIDAIEKAVRARE